LAVASTTKDIQPSSSIVPRFQNAAESLGVSFQTFNDEVPNRYFLPEVMGTGIAWIDFDGDGWLDLFLANGQRLDPGSGADTEHHCQMYRNRDGNHFELVTESSVTGIQLFGQGCSVGDYDADGFPDLFIGGYGKDILLKNHGDGTFEDVTPIAMVSDPLWSTSSLWMDLDGDSLLDLFVVNYVDVTWNNCKPCQYGTAKGYCGPGSFNAVDDSVYRNLGDGTFEEVSKPWGLHGENGKGLAVAAIDFNQDLVPEIYVANDMTANFLFVRRSHQSDSGSLYQERAGESGCALSGTGMNEASMGVAIADFDGDTRPDIFLTHFYHHKNTLYRNLGRLLFEDASYSSRTAAISSGYLGFGVVTLDYDRDGDPDLIVANGHVLGPEQQPQKMNPQLIENRGGVFQENMWAGEYFHQDLIGRSAASADLDNDGDVDVAISQIGTPFSLLLNETDVPDRPYLGLTLCRSNRIPAVGGRVVVKVGEREFVLPITAGGSYLAASDQRLLFCGWGDEDGRPEVEVHWPAGRVDRYEDMTPNAYWRLQEGQAVPILQSTQPLDRADDFSHVPVADTKPN